MSCLVRTSSVSGYSLRTALGAGLACRVPGPGVAFMAGIPSDSSDKAKSNLAEGISLIS